MRPNAAINANHGACLALFGCGSSRAVVLSNSEPCPACHHSLQRRSQVFQERRPQKINNMAQEPFSLDLVFDPVRCTPATMPTIALGAYHNLSQESLETVAESPVAYVTKGIYRGDASGSPVAIKSASTHPHFSKQPHDIVKELRFLTKLSHVNVCTLCPAIHEALSCTMRGHRCAWAWYRASD